MAVDDESENIHVTQVNVTNADKLKEGTRATLLCCLNTTAKKEVLPYIQPFKESRLSRILRVTPSLAVSDISPALFWTPVLACCAVKQPKLVPVICLVGLRFGRPGL